MTPRVHFIFPRWPKRTLWGHLRYKFPALGLLNLAALTPPEFEVTFTDENVETQNEPRALFSRLFHGRRAPRIEEVKWPDDQPADQADLIGISVMTPLAPRAYELADHFRAAGKTVVLGGIHPSFLPEEALQHADAVLIGEGERVWPRLLADYTAGRLQSRYQDAEPIDPAAIPAARRDLLRPGAYLTRSTIQWSRGCPHDCEYCSVTALMGRRFRFRPLEAFIEEFRSLPDRFVFIVDDNIVAQRAAASELFSRLQGCGKWWGSQAPITVADDTALLKQMANSGCKYLFIGFESLRNDNLRNVGKGFLDASKNADRIHRLQDHGIGILGSFIVGLDEDDAGVFDGLYNFIQGNRLETFLISVLTPFPGARLTRRLEEEKRILSRDWNLYDMNTVVYQPRHFTPDELQTRFNELNRALYGVCPILHRSLKCRPSTIIFLLQNLGYREAWARLLNQAAEPNWKALPVRP
jgi:radical SAM superfamily enzyme YgiQ (UPF0313 family)